MKMAKDKQTRIKKPIKRTRIQKYRIANSKYRKQLIYLIIKPKNTKTKNKNKTTTKQ
jgi:hypothetical protein